MDADGNGPRWARRDAVVAGALSFAGFGVVLALWPFLQQGNPNPGTPRRDDLEVDLLPIQPGQTVLVKWQDKPVFVRHRTARDLAAARRVVGVSDLIDTLARNAALSADLPALDANRTIAGYAQWLVVIGVCARDACVVATRPEPDEAFVCPCCASRYDSSGRVRSGPAPQNLTVPRLTFLSPTRLQIG
jgi:ubiquinol-cytochrome c reductase iron-sulfur subunit